MRNAAMVVVFSLAVLATTDSPAETYTWTDDKGVVHFTDDPRKVPRAYSGKVKTLPSVKGEATPPPAAPQPPSAAPSQDEPARHPAARTGGLYGGYGEQWWRVRFEAVYAEMEKIARDLPGKKEELGNLRRKRVVVTSAGNREAYFRKKGEIEADQARLGELKAVLQQLDMDASKAGVALEWRQEIVRKAAQLDPQGGVEE